MTLKPYTPRGDKVLTLLAALEAKPERIFTSDECASLLRCTKRAVGAYLDYAVRGERVFKRKVGRNVEYCATRMDGSSKPPPRGRQQLTAKVVTSGGWATDREDPRIGKVVPGWKPPQMVCARLGA